MNFGKYTLVFCNGDPPRRERLARLIPAPSRIVCADGGAQKAKSVGYTPDLIVGDLDSLEGRDTLPASTEIIAVPNQDNTDFEKTLDLMLARGMDNFLVTAFAGGRIDQTLANIQIAFEYSRKCTIALVDDGFLLFPVTGTMEERLASGTTVSMLSMTDESVVTTDGLAYELKGTSVPKGGHGISNRSVKEVVRVHVHTGGILLMIKDV